MFTPITLDHFQNPRNSGALEGAGVRVEVSNPACGDIMELALQIEGPRIAAARFRVRGCVAAIACGSLLTEMISGRSLAEARDLRREELLAVLGGLPSESQHASHLAMDALAAALRQAG